MENCKVFAISSFAIAILIAIAGGFCKSAFALDYNQRVKYNSNLNPYIGCTATNGNYQGPFHAINCQSEPNELYIKDGTGDITLKPGDSIEIVLSIISYKNYAISLNSFYPHSNAPYLSIVKSEFKQVSAGSAYYILTLDILNNSDKTANYLELLATDRSKGIWSVINQQPNVPGLSSNYFISATTYLMYNYQEDETDTNTINENQQAEKQGRENINNQDKSGDDYGTGNKQESLLNAIKRFGQALTYKKGDCNAKIPAWGKISSGMTVNLCNTGVSMTGLSVILSVVAVFFFIPLAKSWLDTIIGLIREMQA